MSDTNDAVVQMVTQVGDAVVKSDNVDENVIEKVNDFAKALKEEYGYKNITVAFAGEKEGCTQVMQTVIEGDDKPEFEFSSYPKASKNREQMFTHFVESARNVLDEIANMSLEEL